MEYGGIFSVALSLISKPIPPDVIWHSPSRSPDFPLSLEATATIHSHKKREMISSKKTKRNKYDSASMAFIGISHEFSACRKQNNIFTACLSYPQEETKNDHIEMQSEET